MSVFKKLQQARINLQNMKLEKTGHNKFARYYYFELADFLPAINKIFNDIGLCGVVSYTTDIATLTITDIDDASQILITSPMADANLKGCHPIQNLGATETYTRRYLWVTAMEIVEHDAVDASEPIKPTSKQVPELKSVGLDDFSEEEQQFLKDTAIEVIGLVLEGNEQQAYEISAKLDNDEKQAIWHLLDSKTRASLKKSASQIKAN